MPTKEVVEYQLTALDLTAAERRRATIAVASLAADARECVELLDMLGLHASEAVQQVPSPRG
jgi:hypothetical protein